MGGKKRRSPGESRSPETLDQARRVPEAWNNPGWSVLGERETEGKC